MKKLRFTKKEINQYTDKRHQFVWDRVKSYEEKIDFKYEKEGPDIKTAYLEVVLDLGFEATNYIHFNEYNYETWDSSKEQWVEHDPYKKIYEDFKEWQKHYWQIFLIDPRTYGLGEKLYEKLTIEEVDDFAEDMGLRHIEGKIFFESSEGDIFHMMVDDTIYDGNRWELYKLKEERNSPEELEKARKAQRYEELAAAPLQTSYVSKKKR